MVVGGGEIWARMMWGLESYVGRALCDIENVSIRRNVNNKVNVFPEKF